MAKRFATLTVDNHPPSQSLTKTRKRFFKELSSCTSASLLRVGLWLSKKKKKKMKGGRQSSNRFGQHGKSGTEKNEIDHRCIIEARDIAVIARTSSQALGVGVPIE